MADELIVKTKFCINRVKSASFCRIKSIPSKKDKELIFLSNGERLLYLFESNRILNIFSFTGKVRDFVVYGQSIIAVTEDGKVWRVPFSRHKIKVQPKPTTDCSSSLPTNQTIFSKLLSKNTKQLPSAETLSSVHITEVLPSQAILYEPHIQTILPGKGYVITTAFSDNDLTLSFYTSKDDNEIYNPVPSHRMFIKDVVGGQSFLPLPSPILCNSSQESSLQKPLFDALKPDGTGDGSLIILGSTEGHVWSLNTCTGNQKSSKLVWHLEEPVVFLSLTLLSDSDDENISDALHNVVIVIGSRGKFVIIYHDSSECIYVEEKLSGPVLSCANHKNFVIYTNGNEICVVKLETVKSDNRNKVVLVSMYFPIANVIAICSLKVQRSDAPNKLQLAALTLDGAVIETVLPTEDGKATSSLQSQQGIHLKDLLSTIEQTALETKSVEKDLNIIEKVLKKLNQDTTLIFKLQETSEPSQMIKWTVSPRHDFTKSSFSLYFKVQNLTQTLLHENWSFLVQLKGLPSRNDLSKSVTVSHSINAMFFGSTQEFFLALPSNYNYVQSFAVELFLCYNLKILVSKLPDSVQIDDFGSVLLPLGQTAIDVLHFIATICDVEGNGFSMFVPPSTLDELEEFCQKTNNNDCRNGQQVEARLQTLRLSIPKDVFTSMAKSIPSSTPLLTNPDLQSLYTLMTYSDSCLEVRQEKTKLPGINDNLEKHSLRIGLERSEKGVVIVLHAPSSLEVYALVDALINRIMTMTSRLCSTNEISDVDLKATFQSIKELKEHLE